MSGDYPFPRVTRWVGRLIIASAVVQLLLLTVLTAPGVRAALAFDPASAFSRPWTWLSYLFVHDGLWHLLFNMLMLYFLGAAVEARMGSRTFILYYLYCGIGGAAASWAMSAFGLGPVIGASGAVLGVAVAFATFWPDAGIMLFPIPFPIRARTFVLILAGLDLFGAALLPGDGVAHFAHLGGLLFGFLFFRLQALHQRAPADARRRVETAVMAHTGTERKSASPRHAPGDDPLSAELDRVLDKISARGITSLTDAERRFLDELSKRKQGGGLH